MATVGAGTTLHIIYEALPGSGSYRTVCGAKGNLGKVALGCDPRADRMAGMPVCMNCRDQVGQVPAPRLATDDPKGAIDMATKKTATSTTKKQAGAKPAAAKKTAEQPSVDVAAIEKALMAEVKKAVPGTVWTKKEHYQRMNVKGHARSIVSLWRQKAQLRLEFSNGHGGLDIFRVLSEDEVPAGVAEIQRRLEDRRPPEVKKAQAKAKKAETPVAEPAAAPEGDGPDAVQELLEQQS